MDENRGRNYQYNITPNGWEQQSGNQEWTSYTQQTAVKMTNKTRLWLIIVIAVATTVSILALLVLVLGKLSIKDGANSQVTVISAELAEDGTAYIPLYDGTSIVIHEEVEEATITKDRKHVVVFLKDGTIYVTDKEQSDRITISKRGKSITAVRDDGFLYRDKDEALYKILFADYSAVHIGDEVASVVARNTTSVLYATREGNIYTMASDSSEGTKVGTFHDGCSLNEISDDGQVSLWTTRKDDTLTIVLNDGDNRSTLGEVESKYDLTFATFSKDQNTVVIVNYFCEELWLLSVGSDPITVKLGAAPRIIPISTRNGPLKKEASTDITAFYVSTRCEDGANVYHISMSGDRERVLSNVKDYAISDGKIFYIDEESTLYYAALYGASIGKETKLASDVDKFELTDNGRFLYYAKDVHAGVGNLYCYKVGEAGPVKVSSEADSDYLYYSTDGATVFFFKEKEIIDGARILHGTLMGWSYGSERAVKVASEVLISSVSGDLASGEVNPEGFMYMKYASVGQDKDVYENWMYFNGEESVRVATDIIK